jgi:hypothetical protein
MKPRHIVIDGKPYLWGELIRLRREQMAALKTLPHQAPLFELKHDARPRQERKAESRFLQPSLFDND